MAANAARRRVAAIAAAALRGQLASRPALPPVALLPAALRAMGPAAGRQAGVVWPAVATAVAGFAEGYGADQIQ
eukprot:jgi/Tetstr1/434460/TSEL_002496.t1